MILHTIFLASLGTITTGLGGWLAVSLPSPAALSAHFGHSQAAAAGCMTVVSIALAVEAASLDSLSLQTVGTTIALTGTAWASVQRLMPQPNTPPSRIATLAWGLSTALSLHNLLEGVAIGIVSSEESSGSSPKLSLPLALSIAIHDAPEGAMVAVPVFLATGSVRTAVLTAAASGAAELVGAVIGALAGEAIVSVVSLGTVLLLVAGIMSAIVLDEMLPAAFHFANLHPNANGNSPTIEDGISPRGHGHGHAHGDDDMFDAPGNSSSSLRRRSNSGAAKLAGFGSEPPPNTSCTISFFAGVCFGLLAGL